MSKMPRADYDAIAGQWHSTPSDAGYVARVLAYVDQLLTGVPIGGRILDLGCGTGRPIAEYLVRKGYRVVGVDQSAAMLEIAARVVPDAQLIHSDMIDVRLDHDFAAAIAWDSMFHVKRRHHAAIYRKLADALMPGGRLLCSVGGSDPGPDTEGFTSEMYGHTFYYSGYAPDVTRGLLEATGLDIELWEVDDPSSRGHIAVIARKRDVA